MHSFFKSIQSKIVFWALLPFFLVIGGVTFLSLVTIKNTALEVVKKRDVVLAEFAAKRLSENLQKYPLFLQSLADNSALKSMDVQQMESVVAEKNNWLHFFDGGLALFDVTGKAVWSYPVDSFFKENSFPDDVGIKIINSTLRPYFSNIISTNTGQKNLILIAVPILGLDNSLTGVLAGVCSVKYSTIGATYTRVLEYESGKSSYAYLVDGNGNVLYHRHSSLIGKKVDEREAVRNVVQGMTGAMVTYDTTGEMVISGFAPVPGTGWGIVTQGNWSLIQDLIQFYTRLFQIILWSGGCILSIVVFYFMQRLFVPIRDLTQGAEQIAHGNFIEIPLKKSGDEIEVLSKQFNSMARAMKASFASTERRIEELDNARMALSRSEGKIRGIINAVNDIMFMINNVGDILWINDRGKEVFGPDSEGRPYYEVLHREPSVPDDCFIASYFNEGIENDTELRIWSQGKYQDYWCTANVVLRDKDGVVSRVVVVCRNLTEKKQLRAEVQRNAQLAALGELAAGVAHEINNPITGIINYAQILEDSRPEGAPHEQLPGWIIKEGERIAIIVSKLLSFARRDVEKKQAVLSSALFDDVLNLTGTMLKKEHIEVELLIPDDLPPVRAVVHQIQQIILNIISNARYALNQKYQGRDPHKKISITAMTFENEGAAMVRFEFKDYGTGIAKDVMDKVCNPFFSTKPPEEGTGLGLSISYGIIEEHHGVLTVESVEGEWTQIIIDLPVWK